MGGLRLLKGLYLFQTLEYIPENVFVNTVKLLVETHVSIQQINFLEAFIKQVNMDRLVLL